MIVVALLLIGLTWFYTRAVRQPEHFADYFDIPTRAVAGPDGVAPEMAPVTSGPLLDNVLTPQSGLSSLNAGSCYAQDRSVELQLGGQYAQRTNNYRRDYPDNCSAPLTDFVDSMYKPRDGVGLTVPCAGSC